MSDAGATRTPDREAVVARSDSAVRNGILAGALLSVEFIAGMQTYLMRTVVPIIGADLDAHEYYGVITATAQVAMFLTMPLGPWLLQRFRVERLLLHLTWLSILGGVVSAIAPNIGVFVLGRAASGLAAGALATVSLAAIVTALPPTWRRAVLAGYNVMWVATSLIGPLYAGWVASQLSWRWALVLYLPLLLVARALIARQLRGRMQSGEREQLTLGSAALLALGVALLSLVGLQQLPTAAAAVAAAAGVALAVVAARRLLPAGTLAVRAGRPAAIATMGLVTAAYFGAAEIVGIVVHDVLHGTASQVALVLAGGGIGWAVAGLVASRWPAQALRTYGRRSTLGAALLAIGLLTMLAALLTDGSAARIGLVLLGWSTAGVGMGLVYLDTLNHIVDVPVEADGVSTARAATATILVEAIATAITATLASALLGRAVAEGGGTGAALTVLALAALIGAAVAWSAHRVKVPA